MPQVLLQDKRKLRFAHSHSAAGPRTQPTKKDAKSCSGRFRQICRGLGEISLSGGILRCVALSSQSFSSFRGFPTSIRLENDGFPVRAAESF